MCLECAARWAAYIADYKLQCMEADPHFRAKTGQRRNWPAKCGTKAGADRHRRMGEGLCDACRECERERDRRRHRKHRARVEAALIARDGEGCAICGVVTRYHIDHINPVSNGADPSWDDLDNLQLLCPPCNRQKGSKVPDEHKALTCGFV